jgi:protease-4
MKKLVIGLLAVVGFLSLVAVVVAGFVALVLATGKPGVPRHTILQVDFEAGVIEAVPDDPLAEWMMESELPLLDVVDALDRAAGDDRVEALVARVGAGGIGLAQIQEIRDAVLRFRESGKPALAFAETFGEVSPGNGGYYLATAFDEVYLQPSGDIGMTGLIYELPFVRGTLDKLGVVPQMDQRYEYKNAMNTITDHEMTAAQRESMSKLMNSQFDQMVAGIAEARGLTPEDVRTRFDEGPYLGQEAVDAGLVDGLMYEDEVYAKLEEKLGDDTNRLFLAPYLARAGRPHKRGDTVALIHAQGAVVRGRGGYSPIDGSVTMGSDSVVDALREAIDDDSVKAIILRVDSPGGSYVASDSIWRETRRAKDAGKPLVVSMGNLAASGGYFVSMSAAGVVAQPGTITGSIGVLGGKLVTAGFWDKVGVGWDEVHTSANGTMFSATHPYTEHGYDRFQAWLDRVYQDFTTKVAEGRSLPKERVLEIAKGRVWAGSDALELGLVDRLGGVHEALDLVREKLGVGADAELRLRPIPAKRTPLEMFFEPKPDHRDTAGIRAMRRVMEEIQPVVRMAARIVGPAPRELEVPQDVLPRP